MTMRTYLVVGVLTGSMIFSACQKQQTEEERNAQVEREVQNRLAAEHQTQQQEELARREANLDAREKAVTEAQPATANRQPAPEETGRSSRIGAKRPNR